MLYVTQSCPALTVNNVRKRAAPACHGYTEACTMTLQHCQNSTRYATA